MGLRFPAYSVSDLGFKVVGFEVLGFGIPSQAGEILNPTPCD